MLSGPLTWGHVLVVVGLLALVIALAQAVAWLRHRSFGAGTPQYARARDGRRFAIWALIVALVLFALGCLTPLCEAPVA